MNKKQNNVNLDNEKLFTKDFVVTLLFTIILYFVFSSLMKPTLVSGESMCPTLNDKDYLFVNKIAYKKQAPKKGDIVIFKTNIEEKILIKRIIGIQGDNVKVENGDVFVNGVKLDEKYINGDFTSGNININVSKDKVFVMGDNRENSLDSRVIGEVENKSIIGKVSFRVFPFKKIAYLD